MAKKKKYPWEVNKISYSEWGRMDFDWLNHSKVHNTVQSYLFRYNNYHKGLTNDHIMKSTFGRMSHSGIKEELKKWYDRAIGAYTAIEYE